MDTNNIGQKIVQLVHKYHEDPKPFVEHFKLNYRETNTVVNDGYDSSPREYKSCSIEAGTMGQVLSTGEYHNCDGIGRFQYPKHTQYRRDIWYWSNNIDSDVDKECVYEKSFTNVIHFNLNKEMYKSEEGMFQQQLVLSTDDYDTLEAFMYINMHCKVPFKMNLKLFDINEALKLYV